MESLFAAIAVVPDLRRLHCLDALKGLNGALTRGPAKSAPNLAVIIVITASQLHQTSFGHTRRAIVHRELCCDEDMGRQSMSHACPAAISFDC